MVATGGLIYGADYNTVWLVVNSILGNGFPQTTGLGSTYGYNQSLQSSTVNSTAVITAAQWQALANDVNTINVHQTNANFSGYSTSYETTGKLITAADLNSLSTYMTSLAGTRTTVSTSQLTSTTLINAQHVGTWGSGSTGITATGTLAFSTATAMQYYFNQGGKIIWQGQFPGATSTNQDQDWLALLNSFNVTLTASNLATLVASGLSGTINQGSTPYPNYTANYISYSITYSNAVISYTITLQDNHTATGPGPDSVSGTAGYVLTAYNASGAFTGGGNPTLSGGSI